MLAQNECCIVLLVTLTELAPCSEIIHAGNKNFGGGGIRNCGWLRRDRVCNNWLCAWNCNCVRLRDKCNRPRHRNCGRLRGRNCGRLRQSSPFPPISAVPPMRIIPPRTATAVVVAKSPIVLPRVTAAACIAPATATAVIMAVPTWMRAPSVGHDACRGSGTKRTP